MKHCAKDHQYIPHLDLPTQHLLYPRTGCRFLVAKNKDILLYHHSTLHTPQVNLSAIALFNMQSICKIPQVSVTFYT